VQRRGLSSKMGIRRPPFPHRTRKRMGHSRGWFDSHFRFTLSAKNAGRIDGIRAKDKGYSRCRTLLSCYTVLVSPIHRLRNVTVTLEEDVAQWARIEAARRDTSVSRLLGALLKERMSAHDGSAVEAVERLASFGTRHKLSLRGLKVKDLINEGRR
jgi:hypothetical protein